jgi:hypothetical protein
MAEHAMTYDAEQKPMRKYISIDAAGNLSLGGFARGPLAFRAPTRDELTETRFFAYPTHSECVPPWRLQRWNGELGAPFGARPRACAGCRADHDHGDESDR